MKTPRKFKTFILIAIALIIFACPIISGCFFSTSEVDSPNIALHKESRLLSWNWVKNSKRYDIYCNDQLIDSVNSNVSKSYYFYDFTSVLTDVGEYEFKVVTVSAGFSEDDSEKSESVTYDCKKVPTPVIPNFQNVPEMVEDLNHAVAIAVNGTRISFAYNSNLNADGYDLYLYSQSTGLNVYPIDLVEDRNSKVVNGISIELQNAKYALQDEIYAVRIGYEKDGEKKLCSDIRYVNPDGHPFYCSDIYLFDGYINDMYIENIQELRNLVYYSFINRDSEVSIKLSKPLQQVIEVYSGLNGTDFKSKLLEAIVEAFDYFYETRDGYDITIHTMSIIDSQYSIQIGYDDDNYLNSLDKPEPELSYKPSMYAYEEIDWQGYYETCDYTMRKDDIKYNSTPYKFISDRQFLTTEVSSSEQLYWAVENKITPICAKGSRAENIYIKAKDVLNSIISDSMTDYEKVLSIFDWICKNTSYDYYAVLDGAYDNNATLVPAYYLEGVFETGYALCDGFSKAFSLMCNMEGIDTIRIVGLAEGGGHAWNKVLLDVDPEDNIDAQYYVVDITWTELKGSSHFFEEKEIRDRAEKLGISDTVVYEGEEVTSHEYFLVNDAYIASTHTPFDKRDRYNYYKSDFRYDYYNNTTFDFDGRDYILNMASDATDFDLVIESEDDLTAMFYYMLVNNLDTIEVVFDYDFIVAVDKERGGLGIFCDQMLTNLSKTMKEKKFLSQYLFLQHNYYPSVIYNSSGDKGLIMVLENNLLIDDIHEIRHLVEFMSRYEVYGTYELYIENSILNVALGNDYQQKIEKLFESALASNNINIDFTFVSTSVDAQGESYFIIDVLPKAS